jgi:hypothetical protein
MRCQGIEISLSNSLLILSYLLPWKRVPASRYLAMDSHVAILSRVRVLTGFGLVTRFSAHFWFPHSKDHCNCSRHKVLSGFTSRFLVMVPNKVLFLRSYRMANIPHLTHCTNCPGYNISSRTTQKTWLIIVVQWFPWKYVCLRSRYSASALVYLLTSRPLSINGSVCYKINTRTV